MKRVQIVLWTVFFLAGCTTLPYPEGNDASAWNDYGYQDAIKGYHKKSESKISQERAGVFEFYSEGYEKGRKEFCSQDAYKLGISGQPYTGLCDELDWRFRLDFNDGRANRSIGRI